jgi:hypothetical protein
MLNENEEVTMLKAAPVVAACALVVAVFAIAASGSAAMAGAPKCLNKANQYVACTSNLRAKTQPQRPGSDRFSKFGDIQGESDSRRRLRLRAR